MTMAPRWAPYLIPQTGRRVRHLGYPNLYKSCVLCPRAYLRVPDHGDPHLLPCCGYLPWRSRGLNTDSWRVRGDSSSITSTTPRVRVPRHVAPLVIDYFDYAARPGALTHHTARCATRHRLHRLRRTSGCLGMSRDSSSTSSPTPLVRVPRHVARLVVDYFASRRLVRRESRCLGTSHGSSCVSSSTTSTTPRVRVPRHVARLVTRLVVDYFDYARASGCLGTSHDSSRGSSSTTSTTPRVRVPRHVARLVVDFFAYTARLGASARRATRHVARRRLLRLAQARTPCVHVPRHVARLVVWLVVDYFAYAATSSCGHIVHRDYLSRGNTGSTSSTSLAAETSSSDRIASTTHLD
jgi:hypothetical protein